MNYRPLGRTGYQVSEISFGAWAIGSAWGATDDGESKAALHRALDLGVNFIDTADVYGDGHSEQLIAQVRKERGAAAAPFYVATKAGRALNPHVAEGYNKANLTAFVERSLRNLEVEALDLLQLHCPPTPVYWQEATFAALDDLVAAGKVRHYGVSVETIEEAMQAIQWPGVQSVQIIFNAFRMRPAEEFFPAAKAAKVGILARLPLSSGMLSGKMRRDTKFGPEDHRNFNRHGAAFDVGETFSGVDYEMGLEAVEELRALVPEGMTMAQFALRWILMFDAVTCAIPGAKRPSQAEENIAAAALPPLSSGTMDAVEAIYNQRIRPLVHHRW